MWSATYMQIIYQETKKNRRREKKEWRNDNFKHPRCYGGVNKHTAH